VNRYTFIYHCFKCGAKGRADDLRSVSRPEQPVEEKKEEQGPLDTLFGEAYIQKQALAYWLGRGFTVEAAQKYGILVDTEKQAIAIPVHDENGKLEFYQLRSIFPGAINKYKFPKGVRVSEFLFNIHRCKEKGIVCLCEGVMDAMAIGDVGSCIFGKQLSDDQFELLRNLKFEKVGIWLDTDARREASKITDRLLPFFKDVRMIECRIKDACDYMKILGKPALDQYVREQMDIR